MHDDAEYEMDANDASPGAARVSTTQDNNASATGKSRDGKKAHIQTLQKASPRH
jgi:hypothetical protein